MRFLRTMLLLALLTVFLLGLTAQALTISIDCRLSAHLTINVAVARIAARTAIGAFITSTPSKTTLGEECLVIPLTNQNLGSRNEG